MNVTSAANTFDALRLGRAGINRALTGLTRDAAAVAAATAPDNTMDVATALIDSKQQQRLAQVSARVVTAADEMLGTLLDVRA